jgi:hypothetical protein
MGKFKPFLITGIVSCVAWEIYVRFIRPKLFPSS